MFNEPCGVSKKHKPHWWVDYYDDNETAEYWCEGTTPVE